MSYSTIFPGNKIRGDFALASAMYIVQAILIKEIISEISLL